MTPEMFIGELGRQVGGLGEEEREFGNRFVSQYLMQYMPVVSIVGSAVSQEIIKLVSRVGRPERNWLLVDGREQTGQYFLI